MAMKKGSGSPNEAAGGGGSELDIQALMMAAYQAGQQSSGTTLQGLQNDSSVMNLFDRFAALFEPLQSLAERQTPLGTREAIDLRLIHDSLARVDLTTLKSEDTKSVATFLTGGAS